MEIQKIPTLSEKQEFWAEKLPNFETSYWLPSHFEYVNFDMGQGNYVIKNGLNKDFEEDATEIWHRVNTGWAMWKKAINFSRKQAQPVPEGFEQAYSKIFSPIVKRPYPRLENGNYKYIEIDQGWKLWQAATAQAVPEWISVKYTTPPTDETVLVCWDYHPDVEPEKEYITLDEDLNEYWPNYEAEPPTHWKLIPKPPKAQEQRHD